MPAILSKFYSSTYTSAQSLPQSVWDAFASSPREANIMYPHALKTLARERDGISQKGQFWITCNSTAPSTLDFVLSCTEGPLGDYPIFIFSPHHVEEMEFTYIFPRILRLVHALRDVVPDSRVFSVFSTDRVVNIFANLWSSITGIKVYDDPYYGALLSYCTRESLSRRRLSIQPEVAFELRPAVIKDIPEAAELCYGFASESEPFVLTLEEAVEEATVLVKNNQLWVHRIARPGSRSEIASIVAITRSCDQVAAITKVYTNPNWRRRGCAERLVHRVCKHLLSNPRLDSVVLYVAHTNPAAQKVYHRVGFAGLDGKYAEGVSSWLEVGFDRNQVQLGHW